MVLDLKRGIKLTRVGIFDRYIRVGQVTLNKQLFLLGLNDFYDELILHYQKPKCILNLLYFKNKKIKKFQFLDIF